MTLNIIALLNRVSYTVSIPQSIDTDTCAANARPGSPVLGATRTSVQSIAGNCSSGTCASPEVREMKPKPPVKEDSPRKQGVGSGEGVDVESSDSSEQSSDSDRSEEDAPRRSRARTRAPPPPPATRNTGRRGRVSGRVWAAAQSARSNQDGQRRFEERAATHMRAALARRHQRAARQRSHPGGAYARLEAEWRERHGTRARPAPSARGRPALKYK